MNFYVSGVAILMASVDYGNCQYSVVRHNPLSSLSSKLRTFSISAVLNETLSLQCPHNSKVGCPEGLMFNR